MYILKYVCFYILLSLIQISTRYYYHWSISILYISICPYQYCTYYSHWHILLLYTTIAGRDHYCQCSRYYYNRLIFLRQVNFNMVYNDIRSEADVLRESVVHDGHDGLGRGIIGQFNAGDRIPYHLEPADGDLQRPGQTNLVPQDSSYTSHERCHNIEINIPICVLMTASLDDVCPRVK